MVQDHPSNTTATTLFLLPFIHPFLPSSGLSLAIMCSHSSTNTLGKLTEPVFVMRSGILNACNFQQLFGAAPFCVDYPLCQPARTPLLAGSLEVQRDVWLLLTPKRTKIHRFPVFSRLLPKKQSVKLTLTVKELQPPVAVNSK